MKNKKIPEKTKKIIFLDPPDPCPLTLSDWISYLTNISIKFKTSSLHCDSSMHSAFAYFVALVALFIAITGNLINVLNISNWFFVILFIFSLFLLIYYNKRMDCFYGGLQKHVVDGEKAINKIINQIIAGELKDADSVRYQYNKTCLELDEGKRASLES